MTYKKLDKIKDLISLGFKWQGVEMSQEIFYEMLECVPPEIESKGAFLSGEMIDYNREGLPYYDCFCSIRVNGETSYHHLGSMTVKEFKEIF